MSEITEETVLKLDMSLRAVQSSLNILTLQIKDMNDNLKELKKDGRQPN